MMNSNCEDSCFYNYKKLLVFGEEGSGKSSLVSFLKGETFDENIPHTDEGIILYLTNNL